MGQLWNGIRANYFPASGLSSSRLRFLMNGCLSSTTSGERQGSTLRKASARSKDAPVLSQFQSQCSQAATSCARIQSGQFCPNAHTSNLNSRLVVDEPWESNDQDWCKGDLPRLIHHPANGRGRRSSQAMGRYAGNNFPHLGKGANTVNVRNVQQRCDCRRLVHIRRTVLKFSDNRLISAQMAGNPEVVTRISLKHNLKQGGRFLNLNESGNVICEMPG